MYYTKRYWISVNTICFSQECLWGWGEHLCSLLGHQHQEWHPHPAEPLPIWTIHPHGNLQSWAPGDALQTRLQVTWRKLQNSPHCLIIIFMFVQFFSQCFSHGIEIQVCVSFCFLTPPVITAHNILQVSDYCQVWAAVQTAQVAGIWPHKWVQRNILRLVQISLILHLQVLQLCKAVQGGKYQHKAAKNFIIFKCFFNSVDKKSKVPWCNTIKKICCTAHKFQT